MKASASEFSAPAAPRPHARTADPGSGAGEGTLYTDAVRLLLAGVLLVPLVFHTDFLFPYVVPRSVVFRVLLGAGLAVLLVLGFTRRYVLVDRRDPVLSALAVFVLWSALTGVLGVAPMRSIFGEVERMWGVVTWFYLLVFYLLVRSLSLQGTAWLLRGSFLVSLVVAGYAVLQRYHHLLGVPVEGATRARVHATIGNPSYAGIYFLLHVGIGLLLLSHARSRRERSLYALGSVALAVVFTFTGARTALLGAAAALVAALGVLVLAAPPARRRKLLAWSGGLAAIGVGLMGAYLASPLARANPLASRFIGVTLEDSTFQLRFAAWRVAWRQVLEAPLLGIGPENFTIAFSRFYPPTNQLVSSGLLWDRAHNTYLEVLAASGIPGLAAYLAIWAAFFWSIRAAYRSGQMPPAETAVLAGLGVAYLVYLVMWFEDLPSTIPIVLLLAYASGRRSGGPLFTFAEPRGRRGAGYAMAALAVLVVAVFTHQHAVRVLAAAHHADTALNAQDVESRLEAFEAALDQRTTEGLVIGGLYTDYLRSFTSEAGQIRDDEYRTGLLWSGLQRAIAEQNRAIALDPHNELWWVDRARTLSLAAMISGDRGHHEEAVEAVRRAIELSPTQTRLHHLLSELYLMGGDAGAAQEVLHEALEIFDRWGDTHYYLARLHLQTGEADRSLEAFEQALRLGETERVPLLRLHLARLEASGDTARAVELLRAYRQGLVSPETGRLRRLGQTELAILSRLPLLLLDQGRRTEAIEHLRELGEAYPAAARLVERVERDVEMGWGTVWSAHRDLVTAGRRTGFLPGPPNAR